MIRTRIFTCVFALALGGLGRAQWTERVSVSPAGYQGADCQGVSINANGRFVVFASDDGNLVPGDSNGVRDIFLRDRLLGTIELISVGLAGAQANGYSMEPKITPDGRFVVFSSDAWNLVAGDTNGSVDIFIRDRHAGTTELVSLSSTGAQGDWHSVQPVVSDNGRIVAFTSYATNLAGVVDFNGKPDIFARDRFLQVTECMNLSASGTIPAAYSYAPSISADGWHVAFETEAGFVSLDTNGTYDIYVRDRFTGLIHCVSDLSTGVVGNDASTNAHISSDGEYVVFDSLATNLVAGDTNNTWDVLIHPRVGGYAERVSVSSGGVQADLASNAGGISADCRYVVFTSEATNLNASDTNGTYDIYLRDRELGTTELISVAALAPPADGPSYECAINGDGRCAAFVSYATNLVGGDTNLATDTFVRDRSNAPILVTSMCHPGYGIVMNCPCSNPPSGTGRGCNNSSNTGGAIISATGWASLSSDTLTFTTSGQLPNVQSLVLQGTSPMQHGFGLNQGVRCFGGYIRRLYWKYSINGSIYAPDFALSEPSVSVRSAQTGVTIQPGDSLYYAVWYRDPAVSPCPSLGAANVTQTLEVVWGP